MAIIIDIIGSMILSGMVLLLGLRMNMNIADSQQSYKMDVIVQENLVSLVKDLEHDFRKMGYRVSDPTKVVLRADSSYISFCGDMDDDGIIDTVDWYLGPPVTFTPNPNDKYLYRKIVPPPPGGNSISGSLPGVTRFSMRYLNQDGEPPVTLGQIWIVETSFNPLKL